MKKPLLLIVVLATLPGLVLFAQDAKPAAKDPKDIVGTWQGTLAIGKGLRTVFKISRDDGKLTAVLYSIDQGGRPFKANSVSMQGSAIGIHILAISGDYEGNLSSDGNTLTGTFTQGPPVALELTRATAETAWEIPPPPAPPKMMAADADPTFEVATIKPNDSGAKIVQGIGFRGHSFTARNTSLRDLISFAYDVQAKQIAGAPDWVDNDRYDIQAEPDQDGSPSLAQMKSMVRKLIVERFDLKFHRDQRELSAYVLTVLKSGSKLRITEVGGPGPGFGLLVKDSGVTVPVRNSTMANFCSSLQSLILDRPVVDRTGLTGKYDFDIAFMPDDTQFNGHPPPLPPATSATEMAPSFFEAIQQQLGLKIDAQKAQVDVIAIDKVEKPSAN